MSDPPAIQFTELSAAITVLDMLCAIEATTSAASSGLPTHNIQSVTQSALQLDPITAFGKCIAGPTLGCCRFR
jgi:hypothetical protein